MTADPKSLGVFRGWIGRLRFPWLFVLAGGLFLADLFVPDLIPWVDELLLLVTTTLLGSWKQRKTERLEADQPGLAAADRQQVLEGEAEVSPADE